MSICLSVWISQKPHGRTSANFCTCCLRPSLIGSPQMYVMHFWFCRWYHAFTFTQWLLRSIMCIHRQQECNRWKYCISNLTHTGLCTGDEICYLHLLCFKFCISYCLVSVFIYFRLYLRVYEDDKKFQNNFAIFQADRREVVCVDAKSISNLSSFCKCREILRW